MWKNKLETRKININRKGKIKCLSMLKEYDQKESDIHKRKINNAINLIDKNKGMTYKYDLKEHEE